MKTQPFLKWIGGKAQLVDRLLQRLPSKIDMYCEPFIGGGALFFALASEYPRRFRRARLSDVNSELINTYGIVRDDVFALIEMLDGFADRMDEESYYVMRDYVPYDSLDRAARFIYLNKTGFRGMYRVNKEGKFNIPYGNYKNPTLYDRANILACSEALQGVDLVVDDFSSAMRLVWSGDVVYCDPPYVPTSTTASFTGYAADGFDWKDQIRLKNVAVAAARNGAHVVLSNSDVPIVHTLYKHAELAEHSRIDVVDVKHNVNPHEKGSGSRAKKTEVIISIPSLLRECICDGGSQDDFCRAHPEADERDRKRESALWSSQ